MQQRTFVLKIIGYFSLLYLFIFSLYFFINPEQLFSYSLTEKKFFFTKEFSRKQFEKLKTDNYVLVFGTSRTAPISSDMMKKKTLNFYNLYGEPGDILNFLSQLDKQQISNISSIIYLVDLMAVGPIAKKDKQMINYHSFVESFYPLTLERIRRTFLDVKYNYFAKKESFVNNDGSNSYINPESYLQNIPLFMPKLPLYYNDDLINKIIKINNFCKKNNINIKYTTPVFNERLVVRVNFDELVNFYESLLNNGVNTLYMFYYIEEFSKSNINGEFIAYRESLHLNQASLKKLLHKYILKDNPYIISDKEELKKYIKNIKEIQKQLLKSKEYNRLLKYLGLTQ